MFLTFIPINATGLPGVIVIVVVGWQFTYEKMCYVLSVTPFSFKGWGLKTTERVDSGKRHVVLLTFLLEL